MRFLSILVAMTLTAFGASARAAEPPEFKIGSFKTVSKELPKLIKLTLKDGKLALDQHPWGPSNAPLKQGNVQGAQLIFGGGREQHPAANAFRAVQQAAGGAGGTTMMTGTSSLFSFFSRDLFGRLEDRDGSVMIVLSDRTDTRCTLDLTSESDGTFRILLHNADGQLLALVQSSKGRVSVSDLSNPKAGFVKSAESFAAFYRNDPAYIDDRLLPMLTRIGIAPFPGRFSPPVIKNVLARIRRTPKKAAERFNALLKQLDDDDYDRRQEGIKALAEVYAEFSNEIEQALKKPPSEEVKVNLQKVLEISGGQSEVPEIVTSLELTKDPVYLAQLAGRLEGDDRKAVEAHIADLLAETN